MADISGTGGARAPAGGVTGASRTSGGLADRQPRRHVPMRHVFTDFASVLGIPEKRLTPDVQNALSALVSEMDRLRAEIEHRDARLEFIEAEAEQDCVLPIPNRRSFLREAGRLLHFSERNAIAGALVRLDVLTYEKVKRAHGLEAADGLMRHIVQTLSKGLRQTDVLGALGGADLAIVMPQAAADAAEHKVASLIAEIAKQDFLWGEEIYPIEIEWRVRGFVFEETAEEALKHCDPAESK
jgi:diguanylate cyclase (GGDEF)-like protein